jgi:hypothetical protein
MAWIKCSERMPGDEGEQVLVVFNDDAVKSVFGCSIVTAACWDGVEWMYLRDWTPVYHTVTHWQPLPEPPID